MTALDESVVEDASLEWLAQLGYERAYGPSLGPGEVAAERESFDQVYLFGRLREAALRINPSIDAELIEEAIKRLLRAESQSLVDENARVHKLLTDGVPVEYRAADGSVRTTSVRLIDFDTPANNDWLAVNQFTITEAGKSRRPDVLVFVNGLPLGLIELKNLAAEAATLKKAYTKIQNYRTDIPSVFTVNAVTVISDGTTAAMSSFSGGFEHYAPWKTIEGREVITDRSAMEVLIKGVFDQHRFLDIVRNFIVFSDETITDSKGQRSRALIKRVAKYHQYWAVNAAVESTVVAASPDGDRRGGVVWHTQGSGKSLEMVFYAAKIMRDPRMSNPTLVFITDRNDLDDQLFGEVFAPATILPEKPERADTRAELRTLLLQRNSGGIIFTTLQKFRPGEDNDRHPVLTDRRNVVVVADEAHRSQYGFGETLDSEGRIKAGLAQHLRDALPSATFLGFTGTPIESTDKSTRAVFGDYVDIYDLTRAVEDGATVRIFYESRMARVELSPEDYAELDAAADQITEQVEQSEASKAKSRWSRLEAIVGAEDRLNLIAADIVQHWDKRREALFGKGMIVVMSRHIAVRLYDKIIALRPDWHSTNPAGGKIKVVMTGSTDDPPEFQPHVYTKDVRKDIQLRAKNPEDPLELVIVRDMWLTGFDAPAMHTMYVDKPMQGAGLMQAIARVNRRFRDKPGGLIVDYIGLFPKLQKALAEYSPSDRDQAGVPIDEVVAVMLEKHDIITGLLHGCDYSSSPDLTPAERLTQHAVVVDFVMSDPDRAERFVDQVLALAKAFALCGGRDEAEALRDDIRLFIGVRSAILKIQNPVLTPTRGAVEIDTAIGQLVNEAVTADEVVDIYKLAGVDNPELSILSDEFLDSLADKEKPNLQVGLLRRLINDEIKTVRRKNIVQARRFSEQLEEAVNRYTNRSLTTAEIIAELVMLAKEMRDDHNRPGQLGLNDDEIAFYDAIVQNDSAVLAMGDAILKKMTRELVKAIRSSATIDWNLKESVRAAMRTKVRRLLARYEYPPDHEEKAIELVLQQAELFAANDDNPD